MNRAGSLLRSPIGVAILSSIVTTIVLTTVTSFAGPIDTGCDHGCSTHWASDL